MLGKPALKKPSNNNKVKRGKKKLVERSVRGIWLGIIPKTGEHVIAKADGEAIRVRTVQPVPDDDQWDAEAVLAVRALPRKPNPNTGAASSDAAEQVEPQLNSDEAAQPEAGDSGAGIARPDHEDAAHGGPRELRPDGRLLEKIGYTPGCPGCINKQLGLDHRAQTVPCRTRV